MRRNPLARLTGKRPRLMADRAAVAIMRRVLASDPTAAQWTKVVEQQAEQILTLPPLTPDWRHDPVESANAPATLTSFRGEEAPASALDIARLFLLRIQTLGIMWFVKRDDRFRDRAREELLAVCGFPDWTGDEFLVTAESMCGAALGYDWLYRHLSPRQRAAVANAIADKGIRPGLQQFQSKASWTDRRTNWNLVCNSSLMIAAIAVAEDKPQLAADIFRLSQKSVRIGFSMYRPDGGWIEGPGYWHYATQYAVYLVDSLTTALGTDLGFGSIRGFGNTGLYRIHAGGATGKLFNYADSEDHHSGGYWLFWLARRYNHPVDAWMEEKHSKIHPMDLLWFDPNIRPPRAGAPPTRKEFSEAGVTMLRHAWEKSDGPYVGIKAGQNDSCLHAHYDLGSFVFESNGFRWAIDLGPDNYHLENYFTPDGRLLYYRTNTLGHNTLVMNGSSQLPTARAEVIAKRFTDALSLIVLDLTNAYPASGKCLRAIALHRRDLYVMDEIEPAADCETIAWQMHTAAAPEVAGNRARLQYTGADGLSRYLYGRIVEPSGAEFAVENATPTGPSGQNPNDGISKLLVKFANPAAPLRLVVALSPDETEAETALPIELANPLASWRKIAPVLSNVAAVPASRSPS